MHWDAEQEEQQFVTAAFKWSVFCSTQCSVRREIEMKIVAVRWHRTYVQTRNNWNNVIAQLCCTTSAKYTVRSTWKRSRRRKMTQLSNKFYSNFRRSQKHSCATTSDKMNAKRKKYEEKNGLVELLNFFTLKNGWNQTKTLKRKERIGARTAHTHRRILGIAWEVNFCANEFTAIDKKRVTAHPNQHASTSWCTFSRTILLLLSDVIWTWQWSASIAFVCISNSSASSLSTTMMWADDTHTTTRVPSKRRFFYSSGFDLGNKWLRSGTTNNKIRKTAPPIGEFSFGGKKKMFHRFAGVSIAFTHHFPFALRCFKLTSNTFFFFVIFVLVQKLLRLFFFCFAEIDCASGQTKRTAAFVYLLVLFGFEFSLCARFFGSPFCISQGDRTEMQ